VGWDPTGGVGEGGKERREGRGDEGKEGKMREGKGREGKGHLHF